MRLFSSTSGLSGMCLMLIMRGLATSGPHAVGVTRSDLLPGWLAAQHQENIADLEFPVAAIRQTGDRSKGWKMEFTHAGFTARNVTLTAMAQEAYDAYEPGKLVSKVAWANKITFDVDARIDADALPRFQTLTLPERRTMLRRLLQQRFALQVLEEERTLPAFSLLEVQGGIKMHPAAGELYQGAVNGLEGLITVSSPGSLEAKGLTLGQLARVLTGIVGRSVVDKTANGRWYDLALHWTPDDPVPTQDAGPDNRRMAPSISTALKEQLGLQLKSTELKSTIIVLDKADLPSAN